MPTLPSPGQTSRPSSNGGNGWYAIEVAELRTGRRTIYYTYAPNAQTAAEFTPGATVLGGPYTTEAQAEAAFPGGSAGSTAPPPGVGPPTVSQQPANPLAGLLELGHWLGQLVNDLTDYHMWISIGWLLLGLLLIVYALWTLARKTDLIPDSAPVPVPV